jgi:NitT/TauT family transport system substrate-binding protein
MIRKLTLLITCIVLLLAGCTGSPASPTTTELTKIRLPMGYIPSVQYAPFYMASEKGYFASEGLEVDFDYQFETDGVALVGANELPFSVVSAEQVPLARAQGLPVVYFLAWWHDYPVAVAVHASSDIVELADLKGKKIGLPGPFGASYVGLRALLNAAGIQESEVTLDSIGFNQVEALVAGQDEAVVVYDNNEPIQLKAKGYEVRVFAVRDSVSLASNGLITNEKTIAENPELVRRFARAFLRGLEDTLADPDEAFTVSKKFIPTFQEAEASTQREILDSSISYWKTSRPGVSDPQAWENMQSVLLDMGLLKAPIDLSKAFTNEFVP